MKNPELHQINLLGKDEQNRRLSALRAAMNDASIPCALFHNNANIYYLTGRVFRGYIFVDLLHEGVLYLLRRPSTLHHSDEGSLKLISRFSDIPAAIAEYHGEKPGNIALELDSLSYSDTTKLQKTLETESSSNISPLIRRVRSVKTERELEMLRESGEKQTLVYRHIPELYKEGMTDIELQIEIERDSRLHGCLGQFRIAGDEMELFMGNVLTGDNADTPSPYDFAMGGQGMDPSLPVGANGTLIRPGIPVMVDVNGNYTGYMTDMTRCYYTGELPERVAELNKLSADICAELASMMIPGTPASSLYERAAQMAAEAGMSDYFMGHRSHAGFVGHGVGIEINELPVIAPRSKDILVENNVIALEPKFVIPGIGAVGIENTYIVRKNGGEQITNAETQPVQLS